jgi:hypothetical protein
MARWLKSFQLSHGTPWKPESSSWGWWLLVPLTVIYIASNAFVFVLGWFPSSLQDITGETSLPYYTGPVAAVAVMGFGVLWWAWDLHILRALGYSFYSDEETEYRENWKAEVTRVHFFVRILQQYSFIHLV